MTAPPPPPKLFISYSQTNAEYEDRVLQLATRLRRHGVDAILDKWHLRPGQDAIVFMETIVLDPSIRKVAMLCDRRYVERANQREGGAGAEAQIISSTLYGKAEQSKFVAVIMELDERGDPCVPVFYSGRLHIDYSNPATEAQRFDELLRWVHDEPAAVAPPIGPRAEFGLATPAAATTVPYSARRAADLLKASHPTAARAFAEATDCMVGSLSELRPRSRDGALQGELVIEAIGSTAQIRDSLAELIDLAVDTLDEATALRLALALLESMLAFTTDLPDTSASAVGWERDPVRFVAHETLLVTVASLLFHRRFTTLGALLGHRFYSAGACGLGSGTTSFATFRPHLESLEEHKRVTKSRRLSLHADLLVGRCGSRPPTRDAMVQADVLLYLYSALNSDRVDAWFPETSALLSHHPAPFEVFARAESRAFLQTLLPALGVGSVHDLTRFLEDVRADRVRLPGHTLGLRLPLIALLGASTLGSIP